MHRKAKNFLGPFIIYLVVVHTVLGQRDTSWYSHEVKYNAPAKRVSFDELTNDDIWIKLHYKDIYLDPELILYLNSRQSKYFMSIYNDIPTDSTFPNRIYSQPITADNTSKAIIDLSILDKGHTYYVQITKSNNKNNYLEVRFIGKYNDPGCNKEINQVNSFNTPSTLHIKNYNQELCLDDCTRFCPSFTLGNSYNYRRVHRKIYKIIFKKPLELINIKLTSDDIIDLIVYGIDESSNGLKQKIISSTNGTKNELSLKYVPVSEYKVIYLVVQGKLDYIVNYNLCIEALPFDKSCIDYNDSKGDSLEVLSTSLGSPAEGPFIPGEIISFKYTINSWVPVRNNWPYAILTELSGPWQIMRNSTDSIKQKLNRQYDSLNLREGYVWIEDTIQGIKEGIKFIDHGFYPSSIHNIREENGWGIRPRYSKYSSKNPLIELYFNIVIPDSINCIDTIDCELKINTYSDYFAGTYYLPGCYQNTYHKSFKLRCCPNDSLLISYDSIVCPSDSLIINVKNQAKGLVWRYANNNDIHPIPMNIRRVHIPLNQSYLDSSSYGIINLYYNSSIGQACFDTSYIKFRQSRPYDISKNMMQVCPNDTIILNDILIGKEILNKTHDLQVDYGTTHINGFSESNRIPITNENIIKLTARDSDNCVLYDSTKLKVNASPEIKGLEDKYEICRKENSVHFNILTDPNYTYKLEKPNGEIAYSLPNVLDKRGNYRLSITNDSSGCEYVESFTIEDNRIPDTIYIKSCNELNNVARLNEDLSPSIPENPCKKITVKKLEINSSECKNECNRMIAISPNPNYGDCTIFNNFEFKVHYKLYDENWSLVNNGILNIGKNEFNLSYKSSVHYIIVTTNTCNISKKIITIQ